MGRVYSAYDPELNREEHIRLLSDKICLPSAEPEPFLCFRSRTASTKFPSNIPKEWRGSAAACAL